MIKYLIIFLITILFSCSSNEKDVTSNSTDFFIKAADMSFLPLIESENGIYKNNNQIQDPLVTLKNAGCNTIRLRLWHEP